MTANALPKHHRPKITDTLLQFSFHRRGLAQWSHPDARNGGGWKGLSKCVLFCATISVGEILYLEGVQKLFVAKLVENLNFILQTMQPFGRLPSINTKSRNWSKMCQEHLAVYRSLRTMRYMTILGLMTVLNIWDSFCRSIINHEHNHECYYSTINKISVFHKTKTCYKSPEPQIETFEKD